MTATQPLTVYLAAPYGSRDTIAGYAAELTSIGITVTSSWLAEKHEINDGTQGAATALSDDQVADHANTDLREVRDSDVLVLFTAAAVGVEGGGGRHVETGAALALGKPVLVVGEPENVFHRLGPRQVFLVADWHAAVLDLARRFVVAQRPLPEMAAAR
jgi:nucleoside 2-deoxyribosyltransferase